ncbi:MAG TPA: ATP-binding protein [Polyangiales bacterium]|nr:ATP-binding protein [Polyangiales bacterium]
MSLQQLLRERRDEIVARFVRDVERKDLPPPGLSKSVLIDHIPLFLDELSDELARAESRTSQDAVDLHASARQHGEQRWLSGYDLQAVVREYGALRHAIFETARSVKLDLSGDESETLARYLNVGVAGATAEYVRSREEQLKARQSDLEFLSEAGELLGSSLDYTSTLARLLRLLVPRLGDLCIVHLSGLTVDEMPIAHVDPSKVEVLREVVRQFPGAAAPSHSEVLRTGKPVLVEQAAPEFLTRAARSPEHLALLQQLAARSWLAVPLRIKSNVLGTITLAWSESDRRYCAADLLLVNDLARRAASAIDNAQLFDLSQLERARAEAATRAKDEFVAVVSHELRTPLNVIIGWVRLLRAGSLPASTREHALEVVERNANLQNQLVADLLDISRVLTGKVRLDPAQVDLGGLITLVLEDARLALEAKRLQLTTNIGDATVMRGDADRLKQIIWNLLLNAIKFTRKGGEIHVSLRRVDSDLELVVTDNGVGIAADVLPYIFETFRQSDSRTTRAHGGLGIGLSITKHLVDLHGGSVEVRSEGLGRGASFIVLLPVSPVISTTLGVTKVPATTPTTRELSREDLLAGLRVLVVDDEDDARDLLRITLESCGAQVHDAGSAREALAALQAERVDVVVSDIGMPEEDGYSLVRSIRTLANSAHANTPVIALTAFARNEDRKRALLEGFNLHMAKPVEPAELLAAIADLGKHPSRPAPSR